MNVTSTANLVTDSVADLTAEEKPPKSFKQMTNSERFTFVKSVITVEPVAVVYFLVAGICGAALNALETEKACKSDAGISDHICDAIVAGKHENFSKENDIQQTIRAGIYTWALPLQSIVPLILVVFLGPYSDRHKIRKPFIIIPLLGDILTVVGCIFNAIFMKELPVMFLVLLNGVVSSLFGGSTLFLMAIYSYIAEVSTLEMRTLRIAVIQITLNVCTTVAQFLTGPVFTALGYNGVFLLAGIMELCAVLYAVFVLKESREPPSQNVEKVGFCKDLFNPKDIIQTFNLLLKKSGECNRLFLILTILIYICIRTSGIGAYIMSSFYTQSVLKWSPQSHSLYFAVSTLISLIGTTVGGVLFTKIFKFSDYNLINLGMINIAVSELIYAFSTTPTLYYTGCVVSMFGGISLIGVRSISTKIAKEEHMGKVQSLIAVGETLSSTLAGQFNVIYTMTLSTFPGAFYLVSALLNCVAGFFALWLGILVTRKEARKSEDAKSNDLETNGIQMVNTTHV